MSRDEKVIAILMDYRRRAHDEQSETGSDFFKGYSLAMGRAIEVLGRTDKELDDALEEKKRMKPA